jgi:dolichol kinase
MKKRNNTIQKVVDQLEGTRKKIEETTQKINALEFDVHWYRRVFHAFGASFLLYYMLPDIDWINLLKFWIPIVIIILVFILEYLRIKGKLNSNHFFGLRMYEKKRVSSYLFFGVAILILLLFFPQQIAVPCILCACIADPVMGEVRHRFGGKYVYMIGFLVCMIFFMVTWYKAGFFVMFPVSIIGAIGAVIGETKKFWWLDDDFMIQMVPAILLLIVWVSMGYFGFDHPEQIIYSGVMPW